MPNLDDLLAQVEAHRDEIIALEQELVRIPSVNTGVMPTGNETEVCLAVQRRMAREGIDSEILESAPGRGNIIARLPGRSGRSGPHVHVPHGRRARGGREASGRTPLSAPR